MPAKRLLSWMALGTSKFHQWKDRYGKANEHNAQIPRDWWLENWEKRAILETERCKLADAWKHVRVIEQLREKQWRRHVAELEREERALADVAALNVYLRDPDQQRGEVAA